MGKKVQVVAIVGPTASGKTALAISLAQQFNGEIVSCDSMQVYKGLEIGTAKPSKEELATVAHHLIGLIEPEVRFSVTCFSQMADEILQQVQEAGKLPFLVGGTGLYARSVLNGTSYFEISRDDAVRKALYAEAKEDSSGMLYQRLFESDPKAAELIHPNNTKRVIRALEFMAVTGELFSSQAEKSHEIPSKYDYIMFCLDFKDRQKLYDRINNRVDNMLEEGLLEEARDFYLKVIKMDETPTAAQAIGYKELFPYFKGEIELSDAVLNLKQETRRYAKRQLTWFRSEKNIRFIYLDEYLDINEASSHIANQIKDKFNMNSRREDVTNLEK